MVIICPSPLSYARQRPITASHSSRYDMLAIISSRYQYGPFLFFVAEVMSNYLTTDGLKKFSLLPEAPLRPEARGICHMCHMVNPALSEYSTRFMQSVIQPVVRTSTRHSQGGYIFYAGASLAGAGYCRQCRRRPAILPLQLWQSCQVCVKISAQRLPRVAQFYAC